MFSKKKESAGENLLRLIIKLKEIIVTDELIRRNQMSMLANDGCIIKF